jgi:hypothetical protein
MTNKYMKKCSNSLDIKIMQIKTTLRFTLVTMAVIENTNNNKCWWGCGRESNTSTLLLEKLFKQIFLWATYLWMRDLWPHSKCNMKACPMTIVWHTSDQEKYLSLLSIYLMGWYIWCMLPRLRNSPIAQTDRGSILVSSTKILKSGNMMR